MMKEVVTLGEEVSPLMKRERDLTVLRYMARRLRLTLNSLDYSASIQHRTLPMLLTLRERHERKHRIALYHYQELFFKHSLPFVGFFSKRQPELNQTVTNKIQQLDTMLIEELARNSGLVSYSSLELRNGEWCNLVILKSSDAKSHIKGSKIHRHAAYDLSYRYYKWIRLHNGIMTEGLDYAEMQLKSTKQYIFQDGSPWPSIREWSL